MAHRNFKKEDFVKNQSGEFQLEFQEGNIGEGVDLIVEKKNENGEYEVLQAEIKRHNKLIMISWSEPFDGRILFDE